MPRADVQACRIFRHTCWSRPDLFSAVRTCSGTVDRRSWLPIRWCASTRGATGQATVACREHKTSHKIDVLALERGARPRTAETAVAFIGAAKSRTRQPGMAEFRRLEHIRDLLTAVGHDATRAVIGLFSSTGFTEDLIAEAARPGKRLLLAGLDTLYRDTRG